MSNKYKWLFAENRGNTANNNSFYFWQQSLKFDDEIEKYFMMCKNDINMKVYESLTPYEKRYIVWKNSKEHYKIYFDADMYFITLGGKDIVPDKLLFKDVNFAPNKPIIRLGHGNLAIKKVGYTGRSYDRNLFRCLYFNKKVKEVFMEKNNFKDYQLYYSDYLPRYMELFKREKARKNKNTNNIVWFLTWREYFGNNLKTDIFMYRLKSVLSNEKFKNYLVNNNIKFTLCLHQFFDDERLELVKKDIEEAGIIIKYANSIDVMDEIVNNDLLITDYSSIGFDFTILDKPVIMYQPDLVDYLEKRELYCEIDELKKYSISKESELIDTIMEKKYGVNQFFKERSCENVDPDYVVAGKHIDKMYLDFKKIQLNKVTFIGYNFYGQGGTVYATRALAEALLEKGYMVELRSLRKVGEAKLLPYGLQMTCQYDSKSRRKSEIIKRNSNRISGRFVYLENDKNKKNLVPYAETSLVKCLDKIKSKTVVSTRESLHLLLKKSNSEFVENKIYFYHCPAEIFDMNFPNLMDKLKKTSIGKAVFVTENNRKLYEDKFNLKNYKEHIVLGNTIESSRCVEKEEIVTVEPKDCYTGVYLVRIDETRKEDLDNLINFGRYLRDNNIQNIRIDVYGDGGYMSQFVEILSKEDLFAYINVKGLTSNIKNTISMYDCVVDFSKNHSFGMPYIEAVLNGKPVFCMKNVGSSEVLKDIPESFILSYEDLVNKIVNLPSVELSKLYENYDKVASIYSRSSIAQNFIDFVNNNNSGISK